MFNRGLPSKREMLRIHARLTDRRNRGEPAELVLMFVQSDIQAAGLGALAARRRLEPRGGIRRFKEQDFLTETVCYVLRAFEPPKTQMVFPEYDYSAHPAGTTALSMNIQTVTLPERKSCLHLKANPRRLGDDDYRALIARQLMEARRAQREGV